MKVAHIIPCRNKERHIAKTLQSVLDQDYQGLEVIISDQGSADHSPEVIENTLDRNKETCLHQVRFLNCPLTDRLGMAGLNQHLDWIISQSDADIFFITSADDYAFPQRTSKCVEVFKEFNPSMVLGMVKFTEDDGTPAGVTAYTGQTGFVSPSDCLHSMVGGSTCHSFTRKFYEQSGGFAGICGFDAYMPFMATVIDGAYFIREVLHEYINHKDINNTGLQGAWLAANDQDKIRLEELMHFQVATGFVRAAERLEQLNVHNHEAKQALFQQILGRTISWTRIREQITLNRWEPMMLKA